MIMLGSSTFSVCQEIIAFSITRLHTGYMDDVASTPDCDPRNGVRVDFAGTRADGTAMRSHPQLLNGKLRSTTASCGTTALSREVPAHLQEKRSDMHAETLSQATWLPSTSLRGKPTE